MFKMFKSFSCYVGGRHNSGTNSIYGLISAKVTKMLKVLVLNVRKKKSMTVSDAAIEAEE